MLTDVMAVLQYKHGYSSSVLK